MSDLFTVLRELVQYLDGVFDRTIVELDRQRSEVYTSLGTEGAEDVRIGE